MVLDLDESRLLVGPLFKQRHIIVSPRWRIKDQAIEFCAAHEAEEADMGRNSALQMQVYLGKIHLSESYILCMKLEMSGACGSFWRVAFCSCSPSVGWDTQADYVLWALDSVMYCFLLPVGTTSENHQQILLSRKPTKSQNQEPFQNLIISPRNLWIKPQFIFYLKKNQDREHKIKTTIQLLQPGYLGILYFWGSLSVLGHEIQFFSSGKLPMRTSVPTGQISHRADAQHVKYQYMLGMYLISWGNS